MNENSFTTTIEVDNTPQEIFNAISQVSKWWTRDFDGTSTNLGDEFVICHPGAHYSKQKLVEVIPGERIVWLVTDSKLDWLQNQEEWTNTGMAFDISTSGHKTLLCYTHEGLTPDLECYTRVAHGWTVVIREQLFNFIRTGKTI